MARVLGPLRTRDPLLAAGRRFQYRLRCFALRWHTALILAVTLLAAAALGKLLLWLGVSHLGVRFGLVALLSYGVFLFAVRFWIALMTPDHRTTESEGGIAGDALDIGLDVADSLPCGSPGGGSGAGEVLEGAGALFGDEGALVVIALALIALVLAALVGGGVYVLWIGPELLVDAALASLVAARLIRHPDPGGAGDWLLLVLARTWWVALATLAAGAALGWYLETTQPQARTFFQAIERTVADHEPR